MCDRPVSTRRGICLRRAALTLGLRCHAVAVAVLPTGVVSFVLTDVVGSTELWEKAPSAMAAALSRHDHLVSEAMAAEGGTLLKARGEGDSTFSVFTRASNARCGRPK